MNRLTLKELPSDFIKDCLLESNFDNPIDELEGLGNIAFLIIRTLKDGTLYDDEIQKLKNAFYEIEKAFNFNVMLINYKQK